MAAPVPVASIPLSASFAAVDPALFFASVGVAAFLFLWAAYLFLAHRAKIRKSLGLVHLRVLIPRKSVEASDKEDVAHGFKEQIGLAEQLLSGLKSVYSRRLKAKLFGQDVISLEYVSHRNETYFYVVVSRRLQALVEKQVSAYYPDAVIEQTPEMDVFSGRTHYASAYLRLAKSFVYPFKTYQKLESDPINNVLGAMAKPGEKESTVIQLLLRPVDNSWQHAASKAAQKLQKKGIRISLNPLDWIVGLFKTNFEKPDDHEKEESYGLESEMYKAIDEKGKKTGYDVVLRVLATGRGQDACDAQLKNVVSAFEQFTAPDSNHFHATWWHSGPLLVRNYIYRYFARPWFSGGKMVLSTEEISSVFHFPHAKYNRIPEIRWQNFKIVKAPNHVPSEEGLLIGENVHRGVRKQVRIKTEDRFRHMYIIGQTGTGKTSTLQVLARQDLALGNGICVVDPHGDLATDLLPFVPKHRADDVICFNPGDLDRPMGLNILEANTPEEKEMAVQDGLNIMIKLFGNEIFGPRIQDYFRNSALTLMDFPAGGALTDLVRIFTDDNFRRERVQTLKNPIVKTWWEHTFAQMGEREKSEMIPFYAAKFGPFITNSMMRNVIGQTKSSFDVYDCMDKKKILLINLSKGILGDQNSQLLGLIIVSKIQMAAMRRQKQEKKDRKDFFLYIDEFQNYVTDSIESILSEARKYRLGLVVAHQYLGQLHKSDALTKSDVNLKDAIFGNVGTIMSYKIGPDDGEFLEKQFSPNFSREDLVNMDKFKAVMKLSVDGQPTPSFSVTPQNPYLEKGDPKLAKAIRELSRLKYGRPKEFVEREIIFRIGS